MRTALLLLSLIGVARADDLALREVKNLSVERCLDVPTAELPTRCPTLAGRFLEVDGKTLALIDRHDQKKGTQVCDKDAGAWRCRKVTVLDRDLRSTRKRAPGSFLTVAELVRLIATAPTVKLGDEIGALFAPGERPRTCLDTPSHGCAVQAVRLRGHAADRAGTPMVRRRLWLVEDADGPLLQCSDAQLQRCDELSAASWLALAVTLRPSSLAPPEPPPDFDVPDVRGDKRPALPGATDAADTPAGSLDPWIKPKAARNLPREPGRADLSKLAKALETKGKPCLKTEPRAQIDVLFSGEGNLIALTAEGAPTETAACLQTVARKIDFPRFAGNTFHLKAVVLR